MGICITIVLAMAVEQYMCIVGQYAVLVVLYIYITIIVGKQAGQ